ncbi:hypothetical protein [Chitinophaga deserti]|uniref:hypothetical protein n=1 Tax=Chitinophaga deserti TaxID=2164099 RepID=UPI000D6DA04B|nr:hypothetical protein [Chitinophaga deserti]
MSKNSLLRRVVSTADIQRILGTSSRTARRLMVRLRGKLKKEEEQYVTVAEFCRFAGITEDEIRQFFEM